MMQCLLFAGQVHLYAVMMHFLQGRMSLHDAVHAFSRTGAFVCYKACIFAGQVHLHAVMHAFLARQDEFA